MPSKDDVDHDYFFVLFVLKKLQNTTAILVLAAWYVYGCHGLFYDSSPVELLSRSTGVQANVLLAKNGGHVITETVRAYNPTKKFKVPMK